MLIKIESDNYFIVQRLREIDSSYFVVYNSKTNKYEIHTKRQGENTFCVGLPFPELDERAVEYALKTRVENIEHILDEIDKNNKKIEEKNKKLIIEKLEENFV